MSARFSPFGVARSGVLSSGIEMLNEPGDVLRRPVANPERHLERLQRQVGGHPGHRPPPDDPARVDVGEERGERHARPRRNMREIHDPELARTVRVEAPLHIIPLGESDPPRDPGRFKSRSARCWRGSATRRPFGRGIVQTAEQGQIGHGEGGVGHVKVFRNGEREELPSSGRPRSLPGQLRAHQR